MVGDGEPVQGPVNLDSHAVGGDEFLAPDKAKHLLRSQRDPHQSGVEGKTVWTWVFPHRTRFGKDWSR